MDDEEFVQGRVSGINYVVFVESGEGKGGKGEFVMLLSEPCTYRVRGAGMCPYGAAVLAHGLPYLRYPMMVALITSACPSERWISRVPAAHGMEEGTEAARAVE